MISLLVPVYNRDVRTLVNELFDQCRKLNIEFEILVYDDLSKDKYREKNRELASKPGIAYLELSRNLGRSKIRNWLAKNSRFEHVLFMDCDQYIRRKTYVQKYIQEIGQAEVVYGGTSYKKRKPGKSHILHWTYGRKVEAQKPQKRKKNPYLSFRSNNFMIHRDLFLECKFDEGLTTYGYEDTLLALKLEEKEIKIKHIDNPIEHAGLEKTKVFLDKTKTAIDNIPFLIDNGVKTRLVKFYDRLNEFRLIGLIETLGPSLKKKIEKSLHSENPSMFYFQLHKLYTYIELKKRREDNTQNPLA